MSERLETVLAFYTELRRQLGASLDAAGRAAMDAYARGHFASVTILDTAAAPDPAPATQAEHLEQGIFQLLVALVVCYRTVMSADAARHRAAAYLQRLLVGLADEELTPERTTRHGR